MSSLQLRIITALCLAPLALAAVLFLPDSGFTIMICIVLGLSAWEWPLLTTSATGTNRILAAVTIMATFLAVHYLTPGWSNQIIAIGVVWWILATIWLGRFSFLRPRTPTNRYVKTAVGFLILIPAGIAIVLIRSLESGSLWILCMLAIIWGSDIGAFVAGKLFGKRKLAPTISPGKTWAGFAGGLITGSLVGTLGALLIQGGSDYLAALIVSAVVSCASIVGDLHISLLKRHAEVKDTGTLIPGHGGALDRLDSLFAASPVFFFGLSRFLQ